MRKEGNIGKLGISSFVILLLSACTTFQESTPSQTPAEPIPYDQKTPNDMRDQKSVPEESSDDEDDQNEEQEPRPSQTRS